MGINGNDYELSDLHGDVSFDDFAPYAGLGYGNAAGLDGRWHFAFDLGVMFQGKPKVSASATAADPGLQPYLDADLAAKVADIQDQADAYQFYPVLSIGVSFRF